MWRERCKNGTLVPIKNTYHNIPGEGGGDRRKHGVKSWKEYTRMEENRREYSKNGREYARMEENGR